MDEDNFDFVKNSILKKNIIDSIRFLSFLWTLTEKAAENVEEVSRTIILYNASIIEALLLDYSKRNKIDFSEEKYSEDYHLPIKYQIPIDSAKYKKAKIVISIKHEAEKKDHSITFSDTIDKLESFLGVKLTKDIRELKNTRNTLHLSKPRSEKITLAEAEKCSTTLLELVEKLKTTLKK